MSKIKLNVLGLSYSQTQSGAYALVLAEEKGERRIPIIIGGFEAQAIAIELEGLKPPRPLTHDLFVNFATAFNIELKEVNIYKLEKNTSKDVTVLVPGKVLGVGSLNHNLTVSAFQFSEAAKRKITQANGKCISILELAEMNPKGSNVKIMG